MGRDTSQQARAPSKLALSTRRDGAKNGVFTYIKITKPKQANKTQNHPKKKSKNFLEVTDKVLSSMVAFFLTPFTLEAG